MIQVIKTMASTGTAKLTGENVPKQDLLKTKYLIFRGSITIGAGGATGLQPGHLFNLLLSYLLQTPKGGIFFSGNGYDAFKAHMALLGRIPYWSAGGVVGATPAIIAGTQAVEVAFPINQSTFDEIPYIVPELFTFNTLYEQATYDLQEQGLSAVFTGVPAGSSLTGNWEITTDLTSIDYQVAHGLPTVLKASYPTDGQVMGGALRNVEKGLKAPQGVNLKVSATPFNSVAVGETKLNVFNTKSNRGLIGAVLDVRNAGTGVLADLIDTLDIQVTKETDKTSKLKTPGETVQDIAVIRKPLLTYYAGLYLIDFRAIFGSERTAWADASDYTNMDLVVNTTTGAVVSNMRLTLIEAYPRPVVS